MIKTFAAIAAQGLGDPQVLSSGISEAMITTATGLAIGIPALIFYNLLSARAEHLVIEIEQHVSRMLARWKPRESTS
jgi:biopolymer transport protein ExbB